MALIVVGIFLIFSTGDKPQEESFVEEKEVGKIEYIPLYYDLDNPDQIYTRNEKRDFVEVEING